MMRMGIITHLDSLNNQSSVCYDENVDELEDYEPHYYKLMIEHNKDSRELYDIVKNGDEKLKDLLNDFEIKE